MSENGSYVTRAELKATIEPMRADITEMKGDVKTLLTAQAGSKAISGMLKHVTVVGSTIGAGVIGALASLLIHH